MWGLTQSAPIPLAALSTLFVAFPNELPFLVPLFQGNSGKEGGPPCGLHSMSSCCSYYVIFWVSWNKDVATVRSLRTKDEIIWWKDLIATFCMVWVATSYLTLYAKIHDIRPKSDIEDARMDSVMNKVSEGYRFVSDVYELRDGYVHWGCHRRSITCIYYVWLETHGWVWVGHYKVTMVELTETCPNQDVINYKKMIENSPKWQKVDRKCPNWQ